LPTRSAKLEIPRDLAVLRLSLRDLNMLVIKGLRMIERGRIIGM
jgi:hypothetical protein